MKITKKILSIFLSALMLSFSLSLFASAEDSPKLQFDKDGKFKIMVFADSQDDETLAETTSELMNEALDTNAPDLVIYLGDNTVANGTDNQRIAIDAVTEPCRSRNIPYAIVFGNHDQENGVEKEELLSIYKEFGCLTYDADPSIHGCGTCNLPIISSNGEKTAFNLWLIDSGSHNDDTDDGGYDYVHQDQLDWYKSTAAKLKAENGGNTVPAMNFQHIVIPEIYKTLYTELPFSLGPVSTDGYMGKYYSYIPSFTGYTGFIFEPPCPPYIYDGQFDAWTETGDILAAFCGHDHMNSYQVDIGGIENINVPTVGCNSYSNDLTRGVGLITIDENSPEDYSYELLHIYDFALADGSKIPTVQGGKIKAHYMFMKIFSQLFTMIHEMINAFPIG